VIIRRKDRVCGGRNDKYLYTNLCSWANLSSPLRENGRLNR
jgi:hypothetical protein